MDRTEASDAFDAGSIPVGCIFDAIISLHQKNTTLFYCIKTLLLWMRPMRNCNLFALVRAGAQCTVLLHNADSVTFPVVNIEIVAKDLLIADSSHIHFMNDGLKILRIHVMVRIGDHQNLMNR